MKFQNNHAGIFGLLMLLGACRGNDGSGTEADSTTAAKTDTAQTAATPAAPSGEQNFVNYAVPGNTKEIIWLKAGVDKGNKDIKSHAKMMLKDHQHLDTKVKDYLSTKGTGLSVPSVDTANVVTINDKKGKDWDKAWVDKMVEDHSDLLDKLQNSQKDVKDTSLLSLINNTIPVVQSHLAMAKAMQSKTK